MVEIAVSREAFLKQKLAVQTAGWISGPRLLLNGTPLAKKEGIYMARGDNGVDVPIRLKSAFGDPIPTLTIGGETVRLARPLAWYEYVWAAVPMVLLFVGGALGAFVGILTTYSNCRILRSGRSAAARYGLSGVSSMAAYIVFFVLVAALQALFGTRG